MAYVHDGIDKLEFSERLIMIIVDYVFVATRRHGKDRETIENDVRSLLIECRKTLD